MIYNQQTISEPLSGRSADITAGHYNVVCVLSYVSTDEIVDLLPNGVSEFVATLTASYSDHDQIWGMTKKIACHLYSAPSLNDYKSILSSIVGNQKALT